MVTYAEAQQRAEEWINEGVPSYQRREVRVREFDLGFVAWAVDRADGPSSDGGAVRMVISRDGGAVTLWPALPINDVVRRYEEAYGRPVGATPTRTPSPPDAEQAEATSFLLSPPQWLRDAGAAAIAAESAPAPLGGHLGGHLGGGSLGAGRSAGPVEEPSLLVAPPVPDGPPGEVPTMLAPPEVLDSWGTPQQFTPPSTAERLERNPMRPDQVAQWQREEWQRQQQAQSGHAAPPPPPPLPPHAAPQPRREQPPVQAPPPPQAVPDRGWTPPPVPPQPSPVPAPPGPPAPPAPQSEPSLDYAPTMLAQPPRSAASAASASVPGPGPSTPPPPPPSDLLGGSAKPVSSAASGSGMAPPPAPPGLRAGGGSAAPSADAEADSYVPTQFAQALDLSLPSRPNSGPVPPPPVPPAPFQQPPAQPGVPAVGPGYLAVLRYRGPDGSEQQIIQRSAPGTPHPEWQILQEVRRLNVPPEQVLELHTELESCDLPAGYCGRMVQEAWPNVRVSSIAPYGRDQAARQRGVQHLLEHHTELHTHAAGPAPRRSSRVPLPAPGSVPPAPPVPPQALAEELGQAFGPQGLFRYEPQAVSRQGVPEAVSTALTWAGVPLEFGPFFWAQAQPGRPLPTLAELAAERGIAAGPDAGTYLVIGNDYGRQLCVQYGTAAIVAVDLGTPSRPAGPEAQQPRFVNTGLPEFLRCLALLGRLWRFRFGLTPEQAARWTVDLQTQLLALDPAALGTPETWWSVVLEQLWDGLF
ncbi:SUKH-4 family immunity protein [Streptacidiphilus sp. P02-A3a]|uniref:SUKH-4 family immunity protein n=1 Tax=Streptacidiphilus sp. P02-A3a TaxID=2704468 RepID=UPI0015FD0E5B|nr:SUKH-4 family immunity protein [Streptacidiphilus sp. P02-A3a]QMU72812.1 hypothetical protein GXP74_35740 [Streptacidiphilus sp. P02-A3a]